MAGTAVYGIEVSPFKLDGDWYIGIQDRRFNHKQAGERQVRIAFPGKKNVYELTSGKYYGNVSVLSDVLPLNSVRIYAVMTNKLSPVSFRLELDKITSGSNIGFKVEFSSTTARKRFFRIRLLNPKGRPLTRFYDRFFTTKESFQGKIQTAYNDMPGKWQVELKDLVTGKVLYRDFTIE